MDPRKRPIISPIVRQVGFFTPGSEQETTPSDLASTASDLTTYNPVIIPPPLKLISSVSLDPSKLSEPILVPTLTRRTSLPSRDEEKLEESSRLNPITSVSTLTFGSVTSDSIFEPSISLSGVSSDVIVKQDPKKTKSSLLPINQTSSDSSVTFPAALLPIFSGEQNTATVSSKAYNSSFATSLISNTLPPALKTSSMSPAFNSSAVSPSDQKPPASVSDSKKPKATTKAERRALQEAQRAAKAAGEKGKPNVPKSNTNQVKQESISSEKKSLSSAGEKKSHPASSAPSSLPRERKKESDVPGLRMQFDDDQRRAKAKKKQWIEQTEAKNRVELFRHLPQYDHSSHLPALQSRFLSPESSLFHPSVYKVGLQYLTGEITGENARCSSMLLALKEMIKNYTVPPEKTFVRDLTAKINSHVSFLISCRPLGVGMGNAIRTLKLRVARLGPNLSQNEAKASLIADIDRFVQEKILYADKEIVKFAIQKIRTQGDVLLTYGCSHSVLQVFQAAKERGCDFRVIVLDSRPKLEGQDLLRKLLSFGISCTYARLNSIAYIMKDVTRVFLGASAIFANGTAYSRVGSASVAMVAHAHRVPVLMCCETYKFHERVQLDSITTNELGDVEELVVVPSREDIGALKTKKDEQNLQLLNLLYDVMPAEYMTMIITELGMIPPTSVPVILREHCKDSMLLQP